MQTIVRPLAWILVFVAPAAALASWFTPRPELDRSDAVETAVGALESVGITGEARDDVRAAVHEPADGDPVDAWVVTVIVDGEPVELWVQQAVGRLVYVDDRIGPDDTGRLLTDEQFEALGEHRNDVTRDRWTLRNAAASAGALVSAVVAYVITRRSGPLWPS